MVGLPVSSIMMLHNFDIYYIMDIANVLPISLQIPLTVSLCFFLGFCILLIIKALNYTAFDDCHQPNRITLAKYTENQKYLRVPFFLGWPSANTEKSMKREKSVKRETGSIGHSSPISFAGSKTSNLRISQVLSLWSSSLGYLYPVLA